jgi:hypothetical protein
MGWRGAWYVRSGGQFEASRIGDLAEALGRAAAKDTG